jgi:hypothetical protein
MRTTITLEPDVEALVKKAMREAGSSFKHTVNEALRRALTTGRSGEPYRTPTFEMGVPRVPLDRALRLVAELEDDEIARKLGLRK